MASLYFISGDLTNENAVLEWLIQHRSTGEEGEVIEEATAKSLEAMIGTVDKVVVLFCEYNFTFMLTLQSF